MAVEIERIGERGTDFGQTVHRLGLGVARFDEHGNRRQAVGIHKVPHRCRRAGDELDAPGGQAETGRQPRHAPADDGVREARRQGVFLSHPLESFTRNRGLQLIGRNAVAQIEFGKEDLLDDLAVPVAELGLERHGRFLVKPELVAIAVLIARLDLDHLGLATVCLHDAAGAFDLVQLFETFVVDRQRRYQRVFVRALLDEHHALVGQVADHFGRIAHDLPAAAVQGHEAFGDLALVDAVNDAHRLGLRIAQMKEASVVVLGREGPRHALEPFTCLRVGSMRRQNHGATKDDEPGPGERHQRCGSTESVDVTFTAMSASWS